MATFSRAEVARLARLARLELSDAELDLFGRQLGDILAFARQVEAVDTAAVVEAPSAPPADDTLRDDAVRASLDRDAALADASGADREAGLFKVPRVLDA